MHRFPAPPYFNDWNAFKSWIREIIESELFPNGSRKQNSAVLVLMKRLNEDMTAITPKIYYKENDHYIELTYNCFLSRKELPELIQAKLDSDEEVEITEEIERELNLTL